jgi:opacity protein-like surface antigen
VLSTANGSFADTGISWNRGWYVGGGLEYAVTNYLNIGIPYTHVDAERHGGPTTPIRGDDRTVGDHIDMVMMRASIPFFRFQK